MPRPTPSRRRPRRPWSRPCRSRASRASGSSPVRSVPSPSPSPRQRAEPEPAAPAPHARPVPGRAERSGRRVARAPPPAPPSPPTSAPTARPRGRSARGVRRGVAGARLADRRLGGHRRRRRPRRVDVMDRGLRLPAWYIGRGDPASDDPASSAGRSAGDGDGRCARCGRGDRHSRGCTSSRHPSCAMALNVRRRPVPVFRRAYVLVGVAVVGLIVTFWLGGLVADGQQVMWSEAATAG